MVEKERHTIFTRAGEIYPKSLERAAAGGWTLELEIDLWLQLPDGRSIVIRKSLRTRATEQRGRKKRPRLSVPGR